LSTNRLLKDEGSFTLADLLKQRTERYHEEDSRLYEEIFLLQTEQKKIQRQLGQLICARKKNFDFLANATRTTNPPVQSSHQHRGHRKEVEDFEYVVEVFRVNSYATCLELDNSVGDGKRKRKSNDSSTDSTDSTENTDNVPNDKKRPKLL